MATIKSYTDIQQSKKLAKILPHESADMRYSPLGNNMHPWVWTDTFIEKDAVPCWSLAALLGVIRETIDYTLYGIKDVYMSCNLGDKPWELETLVYDNEVDACYELVLKLNELNLL